MSLWEKPGDIKYYGPNRIRKMAQQNRPTPDQRRIVLVAPKTPPYGGMAVQAGLLEERLRGDGNYVVFFPSNIPFPKSLHWLNRIRGLRPFVRSALIWLRLPSEIRQAEVVHVLAASWLYFFLVVL